jgi:hypothetical protein
MICHPRQMLAVDADKPAIIMAGSGVQLSYRALACGLATASRFASKIIRAFTS